MANKYKLDESDTIKAGGKTLYRIVALKSFSDVKEGDTGGYIESEENLSQEGDCWVYHDSMVYEHATVTDNAVITNDAIVYDNAKVADYGAVAGNVKLHGNCQVLDSGAIVANNGSVDFSGDITVSGQAAIKPFSNLKISGDIAFTDNNTVGTL